MRDLIRTSKFLSLSLRHRPEALGLSLDPHGWVDIDTLLDATGRHGHTLTREEFDEAASTNVKQRFTVSPDSKKIRANQRRSLAVDLELAPLEPPPQLYHGTIEKFLPETEASGLKKMQRQHVHLSATPDTARWVGARRGRPTVLKVNAGGMCKDGHLFSRSANRAWLTDNVSRRYIEIWSSA